MKLIYTGTVINHPIHEGNFTSQGKLTVGDWVIEETIMTSHDVEHLIHQVGFTPEEEDYIDRFGYQSGYVSERNPDYDLTQWLDHFIWEGQVKYYTESNLGVIFSIEMEIVNKVAIVSCCFN
jgi:hypothetical protein